MDNVHDISPRDFVAIGDYFQIHIVFQGQRLRYSVLPEAEPLAWAGYREMNKRLKATQEGIINVFPKIGSEYNQSVVTLYPLEKIGNLLVGIAVVRITYSSAFAK